MGQLEIVTQDKMQEMLDFSYNQAINGVSQFNSAQELAQEYLNKDGTLEEQINSLIKAQNIKAATSGFITSLGGIVTLPITLPANITSIFMIQMRMIATIAYMCGADIKDDKVKTFIYVCLLGNSAREVLKKVGINIAQKVTKQLISKISKDIIIEINKQIGFRLLTKFGEKGVINLGKAVPIVGGIIGGSIDMLSTKAIGQTAKKIFIEQK